MKPNDIFAFSAIKNEIALADGGALEASTRIGYRYYTGTAGKVDLKEAYRYFQAGMPNPVAEAWISYFDLIAGERFENASLKESGMRALNKLSNEGNAVGQTLLGRLYEMGQGGFDIDKEYARELYKAAVPFFALAGTYLGQMCMMEHKLDEAISLFKNSAENGETNGMVNLAEIYLSKLRAPIKDIEARALLMEATRLGDIRAQYRLGVLYHVDAMRRKEG